MKSNIKFRRFMSAGLSAALALSLALPSFALEGKEIKGEPAVGGDSEVTVQVLCDHGHTHWEDNGDGTHDEICDDCGDVVTDNEPHVDDDGNGVCDKCGENSHQVLIASIPVVLPIMAKVDGSVTVPSNAEIANLTEGRAIRIKDLDVTLSGGWSLVDGSTTFTEADKGSKLLAMGFRGTPVTADGSMDMTQANWSIAIDGSLPLEMRATIPAQTQKSAESSIGKVTFTLDWAEGSVDPEPEPEPEPPVGEVATAIDHDRMAKAFGGTGVSAYHQALGITVKTLRVVKGATEDGIDISVNQDRTVLATMDDNLNGVIYLNNAYLTSTGYMFDCYQSMISLDVSGLDTSNVTDMSEMFAYCPALTSLDVSGFDTSNVTSMYDMFLGCSSLTSLDVSGFDTSKVTDMGRMFGSCTAITSLDVSGFDTSKVTDMNGMFLGCSSLTSLDVSGFDTSSVTDMGSMFYYCPALTSLDVSNFDTSSVTYMGRMFDGCSALTSLNVSNFDTSNVIGMDGMFASCEALTSLDVSGFKTSEAMYMSEMFLGCNSLISLDVSNFNTSKVRGMDSMFKNCSSLTSLDLSGFETGNVTDMHNMFLGCNRLTSLDASGFDTGKVTNMGYMFCNCLALTTLDVSSFDASNVTNMNGMFYGCSDLRSLYVKDGTVKTKISGSSNFPSTCTIIVGSPT